MATWTTYHHILKRLRRSSTHYHSATQSTRQTHFSWIFHFSLLRFQIIFRCKVLQSTTCNSSICTQPKLNIALFKSHTPQSKIFSQQSDAVSNVCRWDRAQASLKIFSIFAFFSQTSIYLKLQQQSLWQSHISRPFQWSSVGNINLHLPHTHTHTFSCNHSVVAIFSCVFWKSRLVLLLIFLIMCSLFFLSFLTTPPQTDSWSPLNSASPNLNSSFYFCVFYPCGHPLTPQTFPFASSQSSLHSQTFSLLSFSSTNLLTAFIIILILSQVLSSLTLLLQILSFSWFNSPVLHKNSSQSPPLPNILTISPLAILLFLSFFADFYFPHSPRRTKQLSGRFPSSGSCRWTASVLCRAYFPVSAKSHSYHSTTTTSLPICDLSFHHHLFSTSSLCNLPSGSFSSNQWIQSFPFSQQHTHTHTSNRQLFVLVSHQPKQQYSH